VHRFRQQDAQELLGLVLERVEKELLMLNTAQQQLPMYDLLLYALKGGVKHQEVRCLNCNGTSQVHEPCPELSLGFPEGTHSDMA